MSKAELGAFEKFIEDVECAVPYMVETTNGGGYGCDDLCKAELSFFQRKLLNSEKYIYQAITKAQKTEQYYIEDLALFYLMRINISSGNYADIFDIIEKLKLQIERYQHPSYYTMYVIASGWFYSLIGEIDHVIFWNDKNSIHMAQSAPIEVASWCQLLFASCLLTTKKYSELLAFIDGLEFEIINELYLIGQVEITVLRSVALYQLKEKEAAIETLEKAYQVSESNALIMPFVELGNDMLTLVKAAMRSEQCAIPHDWLENIKRKCSAYAKRVSYLSSQYTKMNSSEKSYIKLTKKELECLRDLYQGLSRTEIATCRNVSENAVKLQIRNICDKLGAKNSRQAVRIAYSLNIL